MKAKRVMMRAMLLGAIAGALGLSARTSEAVTSVATSSMSMLHFQSGGGTFNAPLPNASLKANILASSGDVTIGIGGVSPLASTPLVGLTSGAGVTQTRGGGSFAVGQPSLLTLNVDVTYDITDALPSTSYGYFYTLANLIASAPGDTASITANLTYTLDKNSVTSPGVNVTKPLFVTKSTSGVTLYNTTVFGYAAMSGTTAGATSNLDPHKLRIQGTISMNALDPAYPAEARVTGPLAEWNASKTVSPPGFWDDVTHSADHSWVLSGGDVNVTLDPVLTTNGITQAYTFAPSGIGSRGAQLTGAGTVDNLPRNGTDLSQQSASIEMWVRTAPLAMNNMVLLDIGDGNQGASLTIAGGNQLQFTANDGLARAGVVGTLPQGMPGDMTLHHIVAVLDTDEPATEQTLELYIDGVSQGISLFSTTVADWANADPISLAGPDDVVLGGAEIGGGGPGGFFGTLDGYGQFAGQISVLRFYGWAMDDHEVQGLFSDNPTLDPVNLFLTANLPAGLADEYYHTQGGGFLFGEGTPPFALEGIPEPMSASLIAIALGAVMVRRPRRRPIH